MIPFKKSYAVVLLVLAATCCFSSIQPPKGVLKNLDGWFSLETKQVHRLVKDHKNRADVVWKVEEHFSPNEAISYGWHTNVKTNDSYGLLAYNGRYYYAIKDAAGSLECRLDHRQDHLTLFPWRYTVSSLVQAFGSPGSIVGVGALWLNVIEAERETNCSSYLDEADQQQRIDCLLTDSWHKLRMELKFVLPAGSDDPEQARLVSMSLLREHAIHADDNTLLQDVEIQVDVQRLEQAYELPAEVEEKVQEMVESCRHTVTQAFFPSLMLDLAQNHKRGYYFSYAIKLFDESDQVSREQHLQEWFSYEQEMQTIGLREVNRNDDNTEADQYFKLFKYRCPDDKTINPSELGLWVHLDYGKPRTCELSQFDGLFDWLPIESELVKRRIQFVSTKSSESGQVHSGNLLGFGALLMNVADLQLKRLAAADPATNKGHRIRDKWRSTLEWIVDMGQSQHRLHFFFTQSEQSDNYLGNLRDLVKVQLRRLVGSNDDQESLESQLGGLNGEQSLEREQVLAEVNVFDYSNYLYADDITRAFSLPMICNVSQLLKDNRSTSTTTGFEPTLAPQYDRLNTDDREAEQPQLPSLESLLQFAQVYTISSSWTIENVDGRESQLQLVERFMTTAHWVTLGRLDIKQSDDRGTKKYYLNYTSGAVFQVDEQDRCSQVEQLDKEQHKLVDLLSIDAERARMSGMELNQAPTNGRGSPRLYGVTALWRLASRSANTEFLATHRASSSSQQLIWQMEEPSWLKVSVLFVFAAGQGLRLEAIRMNNLDQGAGPKIKSLQIQRISIKVGQLTETDFEPPESCNQSLDKPSDVGNEKSIKFPPLAQVFSSTPTITTPSELSFYLSYQLELVGEAFESPRLFLLSESSNGKAHLGRIRVDSRQLDYNQPINLWLTRQGVVLLEGARHQCKQVQNSRGFFKVADYLDTLLGFDESLRAEESHFLLANLWHLFGRYVQRADKGDQTLEQRTWNEWTGNGQIVKFVAWIYQAGSVIISFKFLAQSTDELHLNSVTLTTHNEQMREFTLRITAIETFNETLKDLELPDTCAEALMLSANFPKLSKRLDSHHVLHMTSFTRTSAPSTVQKVTSGLDEWLWPYESLRSKARQLEDDFLMIAKTQELFDLSDTIGCKRLGAPTANCGPVSEFLAASILCNQLSGPLAFWWLAEQPEMERTLQRTSFISLLDLNGDGERLDGWFNTEHWLIWHRSDHNLSYQLHFERSLEQNGLHWLELERVEAAKWLEAEQHQLVMEIQSLKYLPLVDSDTEKIFLIPKGRGCLRSEMARAMEGAQETKSLPKFSPKSPLNFAYAASLRILDSGSWTSASTILSGQLGFCPFGTESILVNNQRRQKLDGSSRSERQIISRSEQCPASQQVWWIDQTFGHCKIWRKTAPDSDALINLDFEMKFKELQINWEMFALLELDKFELIQTIYDNSTKNHHKRGVMNIYERLVPKMKFGDYLESVGPTLVTLTLNRLVELDWPNELKLELINRQVGFHLTLNMRDLSIPSDGCLQILKEAKSLDCTRTSEFELQEDASPEKYTLLARLSRNFQLTYSPANPTLVYSTSTFPVNKLESQLAQSLLHSGASLSPMQLGPIRFTVRRDKSLVAKFTLIERPTAIERFELLEDMVLEEGHPQVLHSLGDSLLTCSNRCDASDCQMLSFCPSPQICRFTSLVSFDKINQLTKSERGCFTYRSVDSKQINLNQSVQILERTVKTRDSNVALVSLKWTAAENKHEIQYHPIELIELEEENCTSDQEQAETRSFRIAQETSLLYHLTRLTAGFLLALAFGASVGLILAAIKTKRSRIL